MGNVHSCPAGGVGRARFWLSPPPLGTIPLGCLGTSHWAWPQVPKHLPLRRRALSCTKLASFSITLEESQGYVAVPGNSIARRHKSLQATRGGGRKRRKKKKKKPDWQIVPSYEQYVCITNMCSSTFRFMGSDFLHYLMAISKSPNPGISLPGRLLIYHENNLLQSVHRAEKIPNKPHLKPACVL